MKKGDIVTYIHNLRIFGIVEKINTREAIIRYIYMRDGLDHRVAIYNLYDDGEKNGFESWRCCTE